MQIIKNQKIIEDPWQLLEVDEDFSDGDFIIPFVRWKNERNALKGRNGKLGISINGDDDLDQLVEDLDHFAVIALEFPKYTNGRCFSYARLLRERYNYQGELRAMGNILRDQMELLARCGINAFVLGENENLTEALNSFNDISVKYQSAADAVEPLYRNR